MSDTTHGIANANTTAYIDFIETFDSENTKKVARSLSELGEHDYSGCTPIDVEQIILGMKPSSPKAITTITYMLSLYAKYLEDDSLYHIVRDIDRNALWSMAKPMAKKKFISHDMFERVYKDIGMYEEHNAMYLQTLFRCVYEGIYSDDMSVLKNLRGSDVKEFLDGKFLENENENDKLPDGKFFDFQNDKLPDGKFREREFENSQSERQRSCRFFENENETPYKSIVTLREDVFENVDSRTKVFENVDSRTKVFENESSRTHDGNTYELLISNELAKDLRKLAEINTWERKNRFGTYQIKTSGLYEDSCFKVEKRKDFSRYSYRYNYYRILRKISKEYLEYSLLPLQLYVSGIMHRIGINLEMHGIGLEEAFSNHNKDRIVNKVISEELKRCNYNIEVKNFREMVAGHLDIFL